MASPSVVSVLDQAESPLRAPFLTQFRHFSCQFVFIYEPTPWRFADLLRMVRTALMTRTMPPI
jgi:hypothetical protein